MEQTPNIPIPNEKSAAENKIIEQKYLRRIVEEARKEGKKIVTTNGAFDLLHEGHKKSIEAAKNYCLNNILIVLVNSDESVQRYKKIKPKQSELERMKAVSELQDVDYVCLLKDYTPENLLEIIRTDYHLKGSEYVESAFEEHVVRKYGGEMVFIERNPDSISTGKIKVEMAKGKK